MGEGGGGGWWFVSKKDAEVALRDAGGKPLRQRFGIL